MSALFAGPWIGEFGHELFSWQGHIRRIAHDYSHVTVAGPSGHEVLYADFADTYIPVASDRASCHGVHGVAVDFKPPAADRIIQPGDELGDETEYIAYGTPTPELAYDVVFHARHVCPKQLDPERTRKKVSRNWTVQKWIELRRTLPSDLRTCCIGMPNAALRMPHTEDHRGAPLAKVVDILASSKVLVSPCSGPVHLATLCKCPQLVWTRERNLVRLQDTWNPFGTPVMAHVDEAWDPEVSDITALLGNQNC